MIQMNLFTKYKQTHRLRERTYSYHGMGTVREFGINMYILLYLKMDNQQGATVYHGEISSMLCGNLMGWEFGGEWIHVYVMLSHFAVNMKLPQYC